MKILYYSHDAQGNVMAIYTLTDPKGPNEAYTVDEHLLYGSSRLGIRKNGTDLLTYIPSTEPVKHPRGLKRYELGNHLGNVQAVVSDRRNRVCEGGSFVYYEADIRNMYDYYPFGSALERRTFVEAENYRFGFGGQLKDNEIYGDGNAYAYEYRIHDPRIGRFLSVDPLEQEYPWNSPYAFAENKVIQGIDLEGAEYKNATTAQSAKNLGEVFTTAVDESSTMVSDYTKIPQQIQQAVRSPQATISQGGISGSPQYKQFQYNVDSYGPYVIPGFDIAKGLARGEEITWAELGIEIAGIIPIGRVMGKVGKVVAKNEFVEGAFKEVATFMKNNAGESAEIIKSRLQKSIKSHDKQIMQHKEWIADPTKKLGEKWEQLSKQHQDNLLHHWKQDVKRHEAYKEVKQATLDEIK